MIEINRQPKVYIIILNWNGWQDTIECVKSIKNNNYQNYILLIIDNGSSNESLTHLRKLTDIEYSINELYKSKTETNNYLPRKIILIKSEENLGFAAGNNVGLKYALSNNADYCFVLNNDTIIERKSLELLVNFLELNNQYSAATPQIRYFEPNNKIWNCGGKLLWYGARKYYYNNCDISSIPQNKEILDITFVSGCALFLRSALIKEIGSFTEQFFFGEEDFEISLRLKRNKKKVVCLLNSVIYHKIGSSINSAALKEYGKIYIYYLNRFIDIKHQKSTLWWNIWKYLYCIYIFILLSIKKKFNYKISLIIISEILKDSYIMNNVSKEYFEFALKEKFLNI